MKVLKIVLIACALSAAVAHAQTAPSTPQQKAAGQITNAPTAPPCKTTVPHRPLKLKSASAP